MSRRLIALGAVALTLVTAAPGRVSAGAPTETLRPAIDQVLRILNNATLKGPARRLERRAALAPSWTRSSTTPTRPNGH